MGKDLRNRGFEQEFVFKTSKSQGPGGQHVNTTNTQVELRFNICQSEWLTHEEKESILQKLANKINSECELIVVSNSSRSQYKNKEESIEKFYELLKQALKKPKIRKKTKPTKSSQQKRLKKKKIRSEKKSIRKPPSIDSIN